MNFIALMRYLFRRRIKLTEKEKFLSRATSLEDLERLEKIWDRSHP